MIKNKNILTNNFFILFINFFLFFNLLLKAQNNISEIENLADTQKDNISSNRCIVGAETLISEKIYLIKNKKIGIITNHTAILPNKVHLVDTLFNIKEINIVALFGPEHGIRGKSSAGEKVESTFDEKTKIPVHSLYGKNYKPTKDMLQNVEVLIFDIQDVGARFYTYISTLFYSLQSAAENNIPIIVLDRPNPIGGIYVDGPIRKDELNSFVGIAPIPIVYAMTIGELANYFVGENLLGENLKPDLTIIELKNWKRNYYFDDCKLQWINPSPNIKNLETAFIYPGTCLIEGTNISEGRGTENPFLTIGAPFVNSFELIKEMNKLNIDGLELLPVKFSPTEIKGIAANPKYNNQLCNGIFIKIKDRQKLQSVKFGVKLIYALHKLYPDEFKFYDSSFDKLSGDKRIREMIIEGYKPDEIINSWKKEIKKFEEIRSKYLLY